MGAKLVKQNGVLVTNCTTDKDCSGVASNTCCFRTQMVEQSKTSAGVVTIATY